MSDSPPPAPRWVKVSAVLALAFILAVLILHILGGGFGGHMHAGGPR